ncbi:acyl-CoA-binding protein-like [Centroberyx affinis]|uniref:acyl-CoA-binding protein-like n=1 Tax=Centroberyx affinis TaxID=166261 RepID=UPI003A5C2A10
MRGGSRHVLSRHCDCYRRQEYVEFNQDGCAPGWVVFCEDMAARECIVFSPVLQMVQFNAAVTEARLLKVKLSDAEMLRIYGLFKQVTVGDVDIDRSRIVDDTGKAKWDAWEKEKGKSEEDAIKDYIKLVEELKEKYGS